MNPLTAGELVEILNKLPQDMEVYSQVHGERRLHDYVGVTEVAHGELEIDEDFEHVVFLQTQEYEDYHLFTIEEADRREIEGIRFAMQTIGDNCHATDKGFDTVLEILNNRIKTLESWIR